MKIPSCRGSYPAKLSAEMYPYIDDLHKQIYNNWKPIMDQVSDVRMSYVVDKYGTISDVQIGYSNASYEAETAAKKAIMDLKASKFPAAVNLEELRLNHYFTVKANNIY